MFFRKIAFCVVLFCLVSLFVRVPFAAAHNLPEDDNVVRQLKNDWTERDKWLKKYDAAKGTTEALLSAWSGNETAIKEGWWDVSNTVAATVISMIMDAVLTSDSGDGTATKPEYIKELVEALPAILAAYNAGKKLDSLLNNLSARDSYLIALSSAVSSLDYIISENKKAFDFYESEYDVYVAAMANHGGGLTRISNHSDSGDYNNEEAKKVEFIKKTVKDKDAFNSDPANQQNNMLKFWYHIKELKSTSKPSSKSFKLFNDFDTYWKLDPLPKKHECGGDCGQKYRTPVEQLVTCPYPLESSTLDIGTNKPILTRSL